MAANGIHFTKVGDNWLPVGFRFRPTDEELVRYYLQMKLEGMDYVFRDVIGEINICDYEPRDLPGRSPIDSDNKEWYFFSTHKKKKTKNGKYQTERATKEGFWKITGAQKPVKTEDKRTVIGEKRILTFKQGCVRDYKNTDWVMHEYYIPQTNPNANQRDFVLCCVRKKPDENMDAANCHERESSTYNNASDFENQQLLARRMDIQEEHTQQQPSMDCFERAQCSMLGNDYQAMPSAIGANEHDENFEELCFTRRQEDVMLYQKQAASSVNVVPKPQTDRLQVVTDEHSGTHHRQLVNDEHSGTHQRTSRPQCELRHNNALNVKNASSVDVDAELPQINGIRFAPDEYYNNERTHGRTNPTSALEALSKQKELKQQQSKAKEAAECPAAVDFPPKKTSITKSNEEADVIMLCIFAGVIMFCIFAWEEVLHGQWC